MHVYDVTCLRVVQGAWPQGCTIFLVKTSLSLLFMYMEVRDILDKVQICEYYFDGLVLSPIVCIKPAKLIRMKTSMLPPMSCLSSPSRETINM